MGLSLNKIHRELEHDRLMRETTKIAESKLIPRIQASCLAATVMVLHDEYGFGRKRLMSYMLKVFEQFDCVYEKYVSFGEIKKCIYDELGIDFEELEKQQLEQNVRRLMRNDK